MLPYLNVNSLITNIKLIKEILIICKIAVIQSLQCSTKAQKQIGTADLRSVPGPFSSRFRHSHIDDFLPYIIYSGFRRLRGSVIAGRATPCKTLRSKTPRSETQHHTHITSCKTPEAKSDTNPFQTVGISENEHQGGSDRPFGYAYPIIQRSWRGIISEGNRSRSNH